MRSQRFFFFLWAVVLVLAVTLRFWQLGSVPASLYWDEMAMYVDVKSVLQSGQDMHGRPWFQVIYPSYGDFKLPVYIWFATISAGVLGLSEFSLRFPSAVAGVASVWVAGGLAASLWQYLEKKRFPMQLPTERITQVLAMFVLAISPWSVMFSRTAFEGHIGQLFLGLSVLSLLWSVRKWQWTLLAPVLGAVATYSYFSVRFVWVAVYIVVQLLVLTELGVWQKPFKELARSVLVRVFLPLLLFGVFLLPMLRSPLYQDTNRFRLGTASVLNTGEYQLQSNVYRELAGNTPFDRILFHRYILMGRELLKNYADNISPEFLFFTGDPNLRHGTGRHGLFPFLLLPFFLLGLLKTYQRHKGVFLVLCVWWLVALLPASVPENTPHALRSLNALLPMTLWIAFGLTEAVVLLMSVRGKYSRGVGALAVLTLCVGLLIETGVFSAHYFTTYRVESAEDWQDGYREFAQTILAARQGDEVVYVLPFDDRFYLWLMGYGPYTAKEIHTWQSRAYQFEQFPNIVLHEPGKAELADGRKMIVAGRAERVQEWLRDRKIEYHFTKVSGADERIQYLILRIGE